jgi:hypothetical protein
VDRGETVGASDAGITGVTTTQKEATMLRILAPAVLTATIVLSACDDHPALLRPDEAPAASARGAAQPVVLVNPAAADLGTARTIAAALEMVAPGGRVLVPPGEYAEALVIARGVTIEAIGGASGDVVLNPPPGPTAVIEVTTREPVTLRGLTIEHTGMLGVFAWAAVDLTVERSTITFLDGPRAPAVPGFGLMGMSALGIGTFTLAFVRDSRVDLDAAPGPSAWGIFALGDVDARIERNVVSGANFACVEIRMQSALARTESNAVIADNELIDGGMAGAVRVGGAAPPPPGAVVTATGVVDILRNTVRNAPGRCAPGTGINFEVFTGRIEHNSIVDVIAPCTTTGARAMPAAIGSAVWPAIRPRRR